jgi:hypothetical protein
MFVRRLMTGRGAAALTTLACGLAAAGALWTLAALGWRVADLPAVTAPFPADAALPQQLAQINGQHPFGTGRAGKGGAEALAASPAGSWRLLATMAATDGGGTALLDRDGGDVTVVRPGDALDGGERVSRILTDGIELASGGGTRRLALAPALTQEEPPRLGRGDVSPPGAAAAAAREGAPPRASDMENVRPASGH